MCCFKACVVITTVDQGQFEIGAGYRSIDLFIIDLLMFTNRKSFVYVRSVKDLLMNVGDQFSKDEVSNKIHIAYRIISNSSSMLLTAVGALTTL